MVLPVSLSLKQLQNYTAQYMIFVLQLVRFRSCVVPNTTLDVSNFEIVRAYFDNSQFYIIQFTRIIKNVVQNHTCSKKIFGVETAVTLPFQYLSKHVGNSLTTFNPIPQVWNVISAKSWDLFSWRTVEIFLRPVEMLFQAAEILLRVVEISMMNGPDFHDERPRFSCWAVVIFMLNGWNFHDERSRFSCWEIQDCLLPRLKSRSTKGASRHPCFMGRCATISRTC